MKVIGCLCLHGFTGSPYEVEPLADYLKNKTEWKVSVPTLPGHGEQLNLQGIQYEAWLEHAEAELMKLLQTCDQVYVIGFSMGGLIASYLAAKYKVERLVLLSAAALYVNPPQLLADIREILSDAVQGRLKQNTLYCHYSRKLRMTPFTAARQFKKVVTLVRPMLKKVQVPTLIAQGECDGIVPPKSAKYLYEHISSTEKRLLYIHHSKHLICHCKESERLFAEVLDFLKSSDFVKR